MRPRQRARGSWHAATGLGRADAMEAKRLPKPHEGEACNACGYCCTAEPCELAREFLGCDTGPCVALEAQPDGRQLCGLVANPLGYLVRVHKPELTRGGADVDGLAGEGTQLSELVAGALGIGMGCDASDGVAAEDWA